MNVFSLTTIVALMVSTIVGARTSFVGFDRGLGRLSSTKVLFGVRGGGLFGKSDDTSTIDQGEVAMYPAMTEEEIEDWLAHIPVYAVTDSKGSGIVLKPDNDTSVFYFFMSPQMANATLNQLKDSNEDLDLQISSFSMGKIWVRVLTSKSEVEVKLKEPGSESNTTVSQGVEYRLVPDTRDLLGARMLLTMDPADGEALKQGGSLTPEMAQNAIKKAMTEAPKFNSTYNEIPVFMIQQMRLQKPPLEGESDEESDMTTILPMYFNLQNMVGLWQQFASQTPDAKGIEPAINLMDLFELVEKMQEESEIDFRNVVIMPSTPLDGAPSTTQQATAAAAASSLPSKSDPYNMPGDTLGDL